MDVNTRGGLFADKGYGDGIFNQRVAMGAITTWGVGLSPTPTYTVKSGDYGTKIATALVGDPARWRELRDANPFVKNRMVVGVLEREWKISKATADQYRAGGMPIKVGDVLQLPPSWVASSPRPAPAPAPAPAPTPPPSPDTPVPVKPTPTTPENPPSPSSPATPENPPSPSSPATPENPPSPSSPAKPPAKAAAGSTALWVGAGVFALVVIVGVGVTLAKKKR